MSARSDTNEKADPTLRAAIVRHQLAVFLVGSVVLGSLAAALLATIPTHPPGPAGSLQSGDASLAALAVLLLRLGRDADELVDLRHRLTAWRVGLRWYILAVVLVPAAHLAGVALATFWDGRFPLHLERFALLPLFLITSLGEEIGWRGYALPRLQPHPAHGQCGSRRSLGCLSLGCPWPEPEPTVGLHSGRHCVVGSDECRDDMVVQPHRRQPRPDGSTACDVRRGVHRSRPAGRDDGATIGVRAKRSSALPDSRRAAARRRTTTR